MLGATDGHSIGKDRYYAWWLALASLLSFPVSVCGSIGKWYPLSIGYIGCSSFRCEKVVHNAVMSLKCMTLTSWMPFTSIRKLMENRFPHDPTCVLKLFKSWTMVDCIGDGGVFVGHFIDRFGVPRLIQDYDSGSFLRWANSVEIDFVVIDGPGPL